ncbi:MAG TPA: tetratricopeptide repeat protein [Thermoanaerobaculia bacterium]|nr:tetratricopeptide repeat protein [Thermoanaerobaculia bacterium]
MLGRLPALLASGALLLPSFGGLFHLPAAVERWLYNPRERIGQANGRIEAGKPAEALPPLETALRLAPDDPRVQFDAGTARLLAGKARDAVPALERAARAAPPDLALDASYNLGTGRLAAGDAAGAVDALKQALRLDPHHAAAKHNLELALAEREREKLRAKKPQDGPRGDKPGDRESGAKGGGTDPQPDRERKPPQAQGPQPNSGTQGREGNGSPRTPGSGPQPLARFRDQPDMSAQEAAQILRAVENLERKQRRAAAEQKARAAGSAAKDWQDW